MTNPKDTENPDFQDLAPEPEPYSLVDSILEGCEEAVKKDVRVNLNICISQNCPHFVKEPDYDCKIIKLDEHKDDPVLFGYNDPHNPSNFIVTAHPPKECPYYLEHFYLEKS